jgi:hypothetical protein
VPAIGLGEQSLRVGVLPVEVLGTRTRLCPLLHLQSYLLVALFLLRKGVRPVYLYTSS